MYVLLRDRVVSAKSPLNMQVLIDLHIKIKLEVNNELLGI